MSWLYGGKVACQIPQLSELFHHSDPVIALFLSKMRDIFSVWYPLQDDGETDEKASRRVFRESGFPSIGSNDPLRSLIHPAIGTIGGAAFYGGPCGAFDHSSILKPPIWFGEGVKVRSGAKVIGPALIGSASLINTGAVCTRSIVGPRSQIDDHCIVKDSLIGADVYLMAGVKIMHRMDLGHEPGVVHGMRLPRTKMGCVIGDDCVIEAGVVLHPGTVLLPRTRVPFDKHLPADIYDQNVVDRLPSCSQASTLVDLPARVHADAD